MKLETRNEWMAVWDALNQYVQNNDPEEIGSTITDEQRRMHEAALAILDRFDASMARLA